MGLGGTVSPPSSGCRTWPLWGPGEAKAVFHLEASSGHHQGQRKPAGWPRPPCTPPPEDLRRSRAPLRKRTISPEGWTERCPWCWYVLQEERGRAGATPARALWSSGRRGCSGPTENSFQHAEPRERERQNQRMPTRRVRRARLLFTPFLQQKMAAPVTVQPAPQGSTPTSVAYYSSTSQGVFKKKGENKQKTQPMGNKLDMKEMSRQT